MRAQEDPGSGRSPGGGHGNPLQYSCLENPIDRGAWWALVHRVAQGCKSCRETSQAHLFVYLFWLSNPKHSIKYSLFYHSC